MNERIDQIEPDQRREQEAVHRLKRGDIDGLEVLVRTYQVEAVRAANMILRDASRAQDVVQEVFLRVYQRIQTFDTTRPFRPWLMRIVVNEAYRALSPQREVSLQQELSTSEALITLGDILPSDTPLPAELFEMQETRDLVWEALGKLSPVERSLLTMRYFLEFTEREVAEALDCPLGTAKWRLHEARYALKAHLEPVLKS
jgi:RNA polymerase sigma-70 factor (ECF subfamily)